MKKRLLALSLALCLTGSMLGGCGKSVDRTVMEETPSEEMAASEEKTYDVTESISAGENEADSYYDSIYGGGMEEAPNTEEYSEFREKGFASVYEEPLSTFSADVDTASYSNLRRMIWDGYAVSEIPEGAVRPEEIINYFSYNDLKEPEGTEPFGVTTQIMPCPWNDETELLRIGLKTEEVDYDKMPPSNLVFLLDVSGSMYNEDKLPLLQQSFTMLAENLTEKDRVSIVTYAGDDTVVIEGVRGDKTKKICNAINDLEAGGSTHGSKGIETAYALAEDYYIEGGNNRVILATDGDLNVGLTTEEELEELITEKKESGVFLSVLGFGTGNIKDNKMETLADKGNGNYAYIDSVKEAKKVLVEEMGATLLTVCKDVKLQVEFNPAVVEEYRLLGYDNRRLDAEDFEDDKKDAGEIGAGHCVTALYEIVTKDSGEDMDEEEEWLTVNIRYKEPEGTKSKLLSYPVDMTSYAEKPGDDFLLAAAAAEFALVAMDSEYQADASLRHVEKTLEEIDLDDEYKEEFLEMVQELRDNSR